MSMFLSILLLFSLYFPHCKHLILSIVLFLCLFPSLYRAYIQPEFRCIIARLRSCMLACMRTCICIFIQRILRGIRQSHISYETARPKKIDLHLNYPLTSVCHPYTGSTDFIKHPTARWPRALTFKTGLIYTFPDVGYTSKRTICRTLSLATNEDPES